MFFYVKSFTPSDTCDCQIKSQPVHVYESVAYKKACNTEETWRNNSPSWVYFCIFVFILKKIVKSVGFEKKDIRGGGQYGGAVYGGEFKPS